MPMMDVRAMEKLDRFMMMMMLCYGEGVAPYLLCSSLGSCSFVFVGGVQVGASC